MPWPLSDEQRERAGAEHPARRAEEERRAGPYEHAYAIDYGAAAPKYIDAFFQNINWDAVNGRLEAAEKAGVLSRR